MKSHTLKVKENNLILFTSFILIAFYNTSLFENFFVDYTLNLTNIIYSISVALVLSSLLIIILSISCFKFTTKPVLILFFITSSVTSYFMNSYNIIIDADMIRNAFETSKDEALDLVSIKLLAYILIFGLTPSFIIYKMKIQNLSFNKLFISKAKIISLSIVIITAQPLIFGKFYSSFIREHKSIRYYANPITTLYSSIKFINQKSKNTLGKIMHLTHTSEIPKSDIDRELVILVVGETARADRFSLNGYTKITNPLLTKENVYSFNNVISCGTSTAISVPCMFSSLNANDFDVAEARNTENILDILKKVGVNILWRDNNSDSKGVALRVPFENFKTSEKNPNCDIECRDIGMLSGLPVYIENHKAGDILIILHQMGNHGPAYYKRYPPEFEKFTPACKTKQLEDCSLKEINNAYDNAILYTDFFLSNVIDFLKGYDNRFETSMIYISDHGESLGENGIFLHGLPNFMAPESQKKIPVIFWFGNNFEDINLSSLKENQMTSYSHDNLFHTILGIFEVDSNLYHKQKDMIDYTPLLRLSKKETEFY